MWTCSVSQVGHSGVGLHGVNVHAIVDSGYDSQEQTNFAGSSFFTRTLLLTLTEGRSKGRFYSLNFLIFLLTDVPFTTSSNFRSTEYLLLLAFNV